MKNMKIQDIHIGQKIRYKGKIHTVETIDGIFGTVSFDGLTAKATELIPAEKTSPHRGGKRRYSINVHLVYDRTGGGAYAFSSVYDTYEVRANTYEEAKAVAKERFKKHFFNDRLLRCELVDKEEVK